MVAVDADALEEGEDFLGHLRFAVADQCAAVGLQAEVVHFTAGVRHLKFELVCIIVEGFGLLNGFRNGMERFDTKKALSIWVDSPN